MIGKFLRRGNEKLFHQILTASLVHKRHLLSLYQRPLCIQNKQEKLNEHKSKEQKRFDEKKEWK